MKSGVCMFYFCENCRMRVDSVEKLHFVEDHTDRGFCTEKCIMEFYTPYLASFDIEEQEFREELGLESESLCAEISSNEHYINMILATPDEVWLMEDELGSGFFTHILKMSIDGKNKFFIAITKYIEDEPSFIIYRFITEFPELVSKYRRENNFENIDTEVQTSIGPENDQYQLPPDFVERTELKKSGILAILMERRSEADVSFERFGDYDAYFESTLEDPDEIYEFEDEEGDILNTFIKSFIINKISFFYVVISMPYDGHENTNELAVYPIIGFPSVDTELYTKYAVGKRINEGLKS